jgi:hypothetical protein
MKKSPKSLIAFALISFFAAGLYAAEKAPNKVAPCCAKAQAKGETCTHACCVEAAKDGNNCTKCKGSGKIEKVKAKK